MSLWSRNFLNSSLGINHWHLLEAGSGVVLDLFFTSKVQLFLRIALETVPKGCCLTKPLPRLSGHSPLALWCQPALAVGAPLENAGVPCDNSYCIYSPFGAGTPPP